MMRRAREDIAIRGNPSLVRGSTLTAGRHPPCPVGRSAASAGGIGLPRQRETISRTGGDGGQIAGTCHALHGNWAPGMSRQKKALYHYL
jgi:hypothetical protein